MRIRQNVRNEHIWHALQLMRQIAAEILRKSFCEFTSTRDTQRRHCELRWCLS
jgi:hypothetical protein